MTAEQYRAALVALALPVQGGRTCRLLGVTKRMSAYYAAGTYPVPPRVANMVWIMRRAAHAGLSPDRLIAYLDWKEANPPG